MKVELKKRDGSIETMGVGEFSRWMCLMEAVELITEKAEQLKVDPYSMMKPVAIDDYIRDRYASMLHDVTCEIELGIL